MIAGDQAVVTVYVAVPPAEAFEVFTDEIELWWRTGPAYRVGGREPGRLFFEPGVGGRLFETFGERGVEKTFELGRVTAWDPGKLLVFTWRGVSFRDGESTTVEVTFSPWNEGTMVRVRHHGWASLPDDHPVRHGQVGTAFSREIGLWWASLATAMREHAARRAVNRPR